MAYTVSFNVRMTAQVFGVEAASEEEAKAAAISMLEEAVGGYNADPLEYDDFDVESEDE